jgi:putative two-component system response regulator
VVQVLTTAGYDVTAAADIAAARAALLDRDVDVMVCDVRLPDGSGVDLVRETAGELVDVAVVMLTGVDDPEVAAEVFRLGAAAYVVKPFGSNEILINVANALRLRDLERDRRGREHEMERKLVDRSRALQLALRRVEQVGSRTTHDDRESADRLAAALSLRHEETGRHIERVGVYAGLLAEAGGFTEWTAEALRVAAMLHDVGKLGVPDAILTKPAKLTDDEYELMKRHPADGAAIVAKFSRLQGAVPMILHHHERWDGRGYPDRLEADAIPLGARIVGLADAWDAMTTDRPYHRALDVREAEEELRTNRGSQFAPAVVDAFFRALADGRIPAAEAGEAAAPRPLGVAV